MSFSMSSFFAAGNFEMLLEQGGHGYGEPKKVREIGK